jgi:hypothetical protein
LIAISFISLSPLLFSVQLYILLIKIKVCTFPVGTMQKESDNA